MNREILFKAIRKDNGEWVEGYYCKTALGTFIVQYRVDYEYEATFARDYEVIPEKVCQYAGLTDKNGKKIFDNDKLKRMIYTDKVEYEYYTVKWVNDLGLWGLVVEGQEDYCVGQELYKVAKECEVIGSIHDKDKTK